MALGKNIDDRLTDLPQGDRDRLRELLKRELSKRRAEPQPRATGETVPLSYGQQRLWILEGLSRGRGAYNEANYLRFSFALDVEALRRALQALVDRHEALRMSVGVLDGVPFAQFAQHVTPELSRNDLRHLPLVDREAEALRMAADHARAPFDLAHAPLMRTALYRLNENDHLFAVTMHHLVCDGWTMGIFMVELLTFYWSHVAGKSAPLQPLQLQYGDYAVWQRRYLNEELQGNHLAYWREQLADLATLDFPTDRPRPAEFSFRGARESIRIDANTTRALTALAARYDVTLFILLYAIFAVLLHRYTDQEDITIGTPVAGRNRRAFESIIGFFVNTVILRVDASGAPSFGEFLLRARATALGAFEHQEAPFERIVEALRPPHDPSRNPLYQIMFQLMSRPSAPGIDERALLPFVPIDCGITKFDLSLELIRTGETIAGHIEYSTDLFNAERIARMARHFFQLTQSVIDDPQASIGAIELRDAEEIRRQQQWTQTRASYPSEATLPIAFLAQVERQRHAIAVESEQHRWTYGELDDKARAVACSLHEAGICEGEVVAVHLDRGADLIATLLGVLYAGCAYLPIDPATPRERLTSLIEDAKVSAIITDATRHAEMVALAGPVLAVQSCLAAIGRTLRSSSAAESLAYIMYTSGTTGRPKGVAVSHRGVVRLAFSASVADVNPRSRVLQFAPASFDASTFEIWSCLLNGGCLVIFPKDTPSLEELSTFIEAQRLTLVFITTGLFRQMIEHAPRGLRRLTDLITGGEEMQIHDARAAWRALPTTRIVNAYGPTEATALSTMYVLGNPDALVGAVPIGKPLENCRVYIIDRYGAQRPIGIPGELCIGGDGLAIGYWRRPEMNEEKFVVLESVQERVYRTGDVAAFREDGNVLFLGRRDRQVKLNGYRIELGEIESAMLSHPDVRAAVAHVETSDGSSTEKKLVAYCELLPRTQLSLQDMREYLSATLPSYMLPSRLHVVERFPLTKHGKVDIGALALSAENVAPSSTIAHEEPRTDIERAVLAMWRELLDAPNAGIHDNFFEFGGHSLLATRLLSRLATKFGVNISMRAFFDRPTVANLATLLSSEAATPALSGSYSA